MQYVSENKPDDIESQINVSAIAATHKTIESREFPAEQYGNNKKGKEWDTEEEEVVEPDGLGEFTI